MMAAHYRDKGPLDCKIYVGNLGPRCPKQELETEFGRYGRLRNVWVARNPPGFAFVEYENGHDADCAVKYINNSMICGRRVLVEKSSGESRHGRFGGPSRSRSGGGGGGSSRDGGSYGRYGGRYRDSGDSRVAFLAWLGTCGATDKRADDSSGSSQVRGTSLHEVSC
ncbi:hypothetical protein BSL78_19555 [Apostichopus japonicus]|uniref:RRM domain-containing protein n=1 Tax=Stichopus japonicus TaxID=307972 RepID=A0A2G8K6K6_STIJA|nr:hypothetical protein BSL78_19555 [Apostichopus japonicus]